MSEELESMTKQSYNPSGFLTFRELNEGDKYIMFPDPNYPELNKIMYIYQKISDRIYKYPYNSVQLKNGTIHIFKDDARVIKLE